MVGTVTGMMLGQVKDLRVALQYSYGVPSERVTVFDQEYTQKELDAILSELNGKSLWNEIEKICAKVNKPQAGKIASSAAINTSAKNGSSRGEHTGIASQIRNLWKWSARMGMFEDKNRDPNVVIGRFVAPVSVNGKDYFALFTTKHSLEGNRVSADISIM